MEHFDTYLGLCAEVYDISKPTPPEDAYTFYLHYAKMAGGPILEPMCGSGRFLLPMLKESLEVHGFDASQHMLNRLRAKADGKRLKPMVWRGFAQELRRQENMALSLFQAAASV